MTFCPNSRYRLERLLMYVEHICKNNFKAMLEFGRANIVPIKPRTLGKAGFNKIKYIVAFFYLTADGAIEFVDHSREFPTNANHWLKRYSIYKSSKTLRVVIVIVSILPAIAGVILAYITMVLSVYAAVFCSIAQGVYATIRIGYAKIFGY